MNTNRTWIGSTFTVPYSMHSLVLSRHGPIYAMMLCTKYPFCLVNFQGFKLKMAFITNSISQTTSLIICFSFSNFLLLAFFALYLASPLSTAFIQTCYAQGPHSYASQPASQASSWSRKAAFKMLDIAKGKDSSFACTKCGVIVTPMWIVFVLFLFICSCLYIYPNTESIMVSIAVFTSKGLHVIRLSPCQLDQTFEFWTHNPGQKCWNTFYF